VGELLVLNLIAVVLQAAAVLVYRSRTEEALGSWEGDLSERNLCLGSLVRLVPYGLPLL